MKGIDKIKIIRLRDTEQSDDRHNRPKTVLTERAKTFENFMKKEAINKMIVSIRQKSTRSKVKHKTEEEEERLLSPRVRRKVERFLREQLKHNKKACLRSIDLWGDVHYNNVMKSCQMDENFLLEHHEEIREKNVMPNWMKEGQQLLREVCQNQQEIIHNSSLKRVNTCDSEKDFNSMLQTLEKRREGAEVEKLTKRNIYLNMAHILKKDIVGKKDVDVIDPSEFQTLRRCQNYCHLVAKNLPPHYVIGQKWLNRHKDIRRTDISTSQSRARLHQTQKIKSVRCKNSDIVKSFEKMRESLEEYNNDSSCDKIRQNFGAFEVYSGKVVNLMQSRMDLLKKVL